VAFSRYVWQRTVGRTYEDEFTRQAREDQSKAIWPGCQRGHMDCYDQACNCRESVPHPDFVTSRARRLREGAGDA